MRHGRHWEVQHLDLDLDLVRGQSFAAQTATAQAPSMTGLSVRSSDSQEEDDIQEEFIDINEPAIIPYY